MNNRFNSLISELNELLNKKDLPRYLGYPDRSHRRQLSNYVFD